MKRFLLPFVLITVALVAFGIFLSVSLYEPTPDTVRGMKSLRNTAQTAQPLIMALDRYRHDHKSYPRTLTPLYPVSLLTPPSPKDWDGWGYETDFSEASPQQYDLSHSVGRDPFLHYRHYKAETRWYYDPGTGADRTALPF